MLSLFALFAQAQPLASATSELLKTGLLGTLLAISLGVIGYLWFDSRATQKRKDEEIAKLNLEFVRQLRELQELRIQDQKAVTEQLLKLIEKCTTALNDVTNATTATRSAMGELKDSFEKLADEFRRSLPVRRS